MDIIDAEFTVVRPVTLEQAYRNLAKAPKRKWRMDWRPVIGAAALGLPSLLAALLHH